MPSSEIVGDVSVWGPACSAGSCPQILYHRQALGEQADNVAPGSLRVLWVVADAGDRGVVDRRMVEGVQGAAVDRGRQSTPTACISAANAFRCAVGMIGSSDPTPPTLGSEWALPRPAGPWSVR